MAKRRIKRILSTAERKKRIRRRIIFRLILLLFFLICIIGGIIYCIRLSYFRINEVKLDGVSQDRQEEVNSFVSETLNGNKYLFVPNSQILFYSTQKLTDKLVQKFSFIQKVTAKKDYPYVIKVSIIERSPAGLYCESKCYFIDSTGYIFAEAPSFSEGIYMVYQDTTRSDASSPLNLYLGSDPKVYPLLQAYKAEIETLSLNPVKITFTSSREIQLDTSNNGYILINIDRPFDETVQNIRTVFLQGITKFQYIDVRYGNKIFYKN